MFGTHVRKVSNSSRARFLPQHLNHVDCFLLFRRVRGRSSGHEIVRIGANMNFGIQPAYILPQSLSGCGGLDWGGLDYGDFNSKGPKPYFCMSLSLFVFICLHLSIFVFICPDLFCFVLICF